jgi:Ni/Fe-hydrogenase subunit HybB-like protein
MGGNVAILRKKQRSIPVSFYPLAALSLLALVLSIYRFAVGLGPTTNMNDYFPWGIWITLDFFIIPVAGSAFTISLISYFFTRKHYHSIIRPAVVAGVLGYLIVGAMLMLDIGRWHQFYNILIPGYINLHSFLEEVSLSVTFYTLILLIEVAPIFLERWNIKAPIRWINRSILILAGLGIIFSTMHQSSLGSMFLILRNKLHPLWWTPALPILFFLQATYTGLGTTAIAITLIWRAKGIPLNREVFRRIGQAMGISLVLYLAVRAGDWMGAGEVEQLLFPDSWGILAWLEITIGVLIPLLILFSKFIGHSRGPLWAGVFALIGTFINRTIISWVGLADPSPELYTPHWIELAIAVGLIAAGLLAYGVVVRYFKLFPDPGEAH